MSSISFNPRIVYLLYFASHIPITVFFDSQVVLPKWLYPSFLQGMVVAYAESFKDPFILNPPEWYTSFCICELLLQFPFFFVATFAFWKGGCKWIRVPCLIYSSHVATTVIAIIYHIMFANFTSQTGSASVIVGPSTLTERLQLSAVYVPYLIVPLMLLFSMSLSHEYQAVSTEQRTKLH